SFFGGPCHGLWSRATSYHRDLWILCGFGAETHKVRLGTKALLAPYMNSMKFSQHFEILQGRRREINLILAFACVAGLIWGFIALAEEVFEGDTEHFDRMVAAAMQTGGAGYDPIGPAWLEEFARDVTSLGSYAFLGFLSFGIIGYF